MNGEARELRLGIVGGCLSHQVGIALGQLYHRRLAAMLFADTGARMRVAIARDWEQSYEERLAALARHAVLDGVLLHIRSAFQEKAGLMTLRWVDGKRRHRLHPRLLRRKPAAAPHAPRIAQRGVGQNVELHETPPGGPRIGGFRLFDLNLVAGSLLGLDRWAIADQLQMLERCRRLCVARDLPLIILGPTPVGLSPWRSRLCGRMNRALQQRVPELGLQLACIEGLTDDAGRPLLKADGFHMTAQGHAYVADRLPEPLAAWARSCLAKGANSRPPQSDSSLQYRGSAEKNLA